MTDKEVSFWVRARGNVRRRLIAGLLLLVPIGVTFLILRFLFRTTSGLLGPLITPLAPRLPSAAVAVVSVGILVVLLYLAGLLTTYIVGRRLIALGDAVIARIPLAKTIYGASKQVIQTLSVPDRGAFKGVAWVEFPRPGFLALGFVTGRIQDDKGNDFYKLFIPTTPNPTSGFFEVVPCGEVRETNIPIDEAMRIIISGGILAPSRLDGISPGEPADRGAGVK